MYNTKLFPQRLEQALNMQKMKAAELVIKANAYTPMTRADITQYMKGTYFPTMQKLCAMATVLDVSIDWLCGNSK